MKTKRKTVWNEINWKKIQLRVWRIQTKIYDCSLKGNKVQVIRLQKTLINLLEAKLLAVRKVTQDNCGKKKYIPSYLIDVLSPYNVLDLQIIHKELFNKNKSKANRKENSYWSWLVSKLN